MVGESRPAPSWGRTLAIAASVALHALVLLLLVWRLGTAPHVADAPAMSVELTPPWPKATRPPAPKVRRERAAPRPVPRASTAPPDVRPRITVPDTREATGFAPPLPGDGVRRVLRGLGCEHAALLGLTPEERRRCEDRLAEAARHPGPAGLNLDTRGAFGREAEPYLQRRPKKGCKMRAGGDVAPMGEVGAATGVSCAWSF